MGTNFYLHTPQMMKLAKQVREDTCENLRKAAQGILSAKTVEEYQQWLDIICSTPRDALSLDSRHGGIHIGKSSAGWCFSLRVYPNAEYSQNLMGHVDDTGREHKIKPINDLEDWIPLIENPENVIMDEYGTVMTPREMKSRIIDRGRDDPIPFDFDYARNHAEPGPLNLLRHQVNGWHCIKHGEGTWDCIVGEFF